MARISTIGMRTGMRSTSPCMTTLTRPLRTTETSKLVPPMSTPIRLSSPRVLLSSAQAALPPDGPESRSRTGSSAAVLAAHTPPFDCTRSNRGAKPFRLHAVRELVEISRNDRNQYRVEHGGRRALVFADLRAQGARARDLERRPGLCKVLGDVLFMLRVEVGIHQADGDADRIDPVDRRGEVFQRRMASAALRHGRPAVFFPATPMRQSRGMSVGGCCGLSA